MASSLDRLGASMSPRAWSFRSGMAPGRSNVAPAREPRGPMPGNLAVLAHVIAVREARRIEGSGAASRRPRVGRVGAFPVHWHSLVSAAARCADA